MFILGKLLNMRSGAKDAEDGMSLLEHLEDLRGTIVRILITLIVGCAVCFVFKDQLMELMRRPIDGVWSLQLNTSLHKLPKEIDAPLWERSAKASQDASNLSPVQRAHFYETLADGDPDFVFHVEAVGYYRSVLAIQGEKAQLQYIQEMPELSDPMREQLTALVERYHESGGLAPDPAADSRRRLVFMQSLHPTEGFMLSFKLALYAGIALTFPLLLYFILQFVLPGLHKNERKVLYPSLIIGFGLFLSGAIFAYAVVLPRALEFFSTYSGGMGISNDWRIGEYISFTTQFVLIFGLAFELPVLVMALVVLDFLSYTTMAKSRSYAIIGILVTAAVITPTPDAFTLGLLAVPMYLLYEICIWLAWFIERRRKKKDAEEEALEKKRVEELVAKIQAEEARRLEEFPDCEESHCEEYLCEQEAEGTAPDEPPASKPPAVPAIAGAPTLISYACEDGADLADHPIEDDEYEPEDYNADPTLDADAKLDRILQEMKEDKLSPGEIDIEALEGGGGATNPEAEDAAAGGAPDDDPEPTAPETEKKPK